jgi:signal transduction histidine kinase
VSRETQRQIDADVAEEVQEVTGAAGSLAIPALRREIAVYSSQPDDRMHYLLQSDAGRLETGDLPAMAPRLGAFTIMVARLRVPVRGRGIMVDGGYLFMGEDELEQPRLRAALWDSFVLTIVLTSLLAIGGGVVMSLGVVRRVEAVSRASRDIIAGDLSRRIPLRGTEDEFDQLGTVVNQMLERIESLMEGVKQVSAGIAHDLRTPLTRVRQRMELAAASDQPAELRLVLSQSIADIEAILATFTALLRIGQIESGSRRAGFATVDLAALALGLGEAFGPVAEEKGQDLAVDIVPGVTIQGDRALLTQLGSNLIENAIRHCPAGCRIRVAVRGERGAAVFSVADDGPGIAADQRSAAITRFVRLPESAATQGTGLGLAMASAIAALHETRLVLEDNSPGLCVSVRFSPAIVAAGRDQPRRLARS